MSAAGTFEEAGETMGVVEFCAMAEIATSDFILVLSRADSIFYGQTYANTIRVSFSFIGIWATMVVGFILSESFLHSEAGDKKKSGNKLYPDAMESADISRQLKKIAKIGSEEAEKVTKMNNVQNLASYIESVFPVVFSGKDPYTRMMTEVTSSHLLMTVFTGPDRKSRLINLAEFITLMNVTLLVTAFVTSLEFKGDDGECQTFLDEVSCIEVMSPYDHELSKCSWSDVTDPDTDVITPTCVFNTVNSTLFIFLVCTGIAVAFMVPFRIFVAYLFQGLLHAPTAQDLIDSEALEQSWLSAIRGSVVGMGRRMSSAGAALGRRMSAIMPDLPTSIKSRVTRPKRELNIELWSRSMTVPDSVRSIRHVAVGAIPQAKITTMTIQDSASISADRFLDISAEDMFSSLDKSISMFVRGGHAGAIKSGDLNNFSSQWDVVIKGKSLERSLVHWDSRYGCIDGLSNLQDLAKEKVAELQRYPDYAIGAELVRLFCLDLLGKNTPEGHLFAEKSMEYFKTTRVVSWNLKVIAWIAIFFINYWCFNLCIVYGEVKGTFWQGNWMSLAMILCVFTVVFDMTFEAVMLNYVIPNQIAPAVKATQAIIRGSALDKDSLLAKAADTDRKKIMLVKKIEAKGVKSKNTASDSSDSESESDQTNSDSEGEDEQDNRRGWDASTFSSTDYLFLSSLVARKFFHLPEAALVLSYKSALPLKARLSYGDRQEANKTLTLGRIGRRVIGSCVAFSLVGLLISIGGFPFVLQKVIITLPIPLLSGVFSSILVALIYAGNGAEFYFACAFLSALFWGVVFIALRFRRKQQKLLVQHQEEKRVLVEELRKRANEEFILKKEEEKSSLATISNSNHPSDDDILASSPNNRDVVDGVRAVGLDMTSDKNGGNVGKSAKVSSKAIIVGVEKIEEPIIDETRPFAFEATSSASLNTIGDIFNIDDDDDDISLLSNMTGLTGSGDILSKVISSLPPDLSSQVAKLKKPKSDIDELETQYENLKVDKKEDEVKKKMKSKGKKAKKKPLRTQDTESSEHDNISGEDDEIRPAEVYETKQKIKKKVMRVKVKKIKA